MTALISNLKVMKLYNLLTGEQLSMEITQLPVCKKTYNNQLQQSIHLCHKINLSQIWQVNTLCQSQSETSHHDAHLYLLTNVPTKCQPSAPYRIQETAWTRF